MRNIRGKGRRFPRAFNGRLLVLRFAGRETVHGLACVFSGLISESGDDLPNAVRRECMPGDRPGVVPAPAHDGVADLLGIG